MVLREREMEKTKEEDQMVVGEKLKLMLLLPEGVVRQK